jgi:integrase/recombinase XerC
MFLESFASYLTYEKRYSPNTIASYQTDLVQFFDFLSRTYEIQANQLKQISHIHIRSWIVELINTNISTRSVNRKISSLKTFYKFLLKKGEVDKNPTIKLIVPKSTKKLPAFVEVKHFDNLLQIVEALPQSNEKERFSYQRTKLIVQTFYATGLRLSELINMTESSIDFANSQIKVVGKGNKQRIIPFGKKYEQELKQYVNLRNQMELDEQEPWLFVTDKGKKLYPKFVYRLINKLLSLVTTIDQKSPHVLRHTFATHLSNNGAELGAIKELLGHASLAATQVYTHTTIEKLKEVYRQAHPKA